MLQLSLEILTGVCAQLPDPEPVEDSMIEDEANMDEGEMDDDEIIQNGGASRQTSSSAQHQLISLLTDDMTMDADDDTPNPPREADANSVGLLRTLTPLLLVLSTPTSMSFSAPTPLATAPITESTSASTKLEHSPTTSALVAVHIAALECLSNLVLSFPAPDSGPVDPTVAELAVAAWPQTWNVLSTALNAPSSASRRMEVAVAALGVLWGLARLARGVLIPQQEHIEQLIQIADSSQANEQVQVKCVGILGSLAQNVKEVEMNRVSNACPCVGTSC